MATPTKGGLIRTFASTVIDRVTGRSAVATTAAAAAAAKPTATPEQMQAGFAPATQFFGAGMPMSPVAPAGSTTGRAFDFPSYVNSNYSPRSEPGEGVGFRTLRKLASPGDGGLDLLRLAIETRKDQMVAQRWSIRGRAKNDDGGDRARTIETILRKPDGVHTYRVWLRMLLEDHFVIDAPTIYFSNGFSARTGARPLLEVVDGATIKKLITSDDGRVPQPPLPAYQQVLVGMTAESYTLDEIGYYAYNLLPYRLYGMSRVEQVLVHITTAIRRAMSTLDFFTEGTTPDGFIEVPKEWTVEQIQQYAEWFNSILTGQSGERRRLQFVPNGANYKPTKEAILKNEFDEWLARIICFCFSLPPQALVKETNRATAQTNKEAAQEEGLEPTKLWFKDLMDDALERIGAADLEWQWQDDEIVDPAVRATVAQTCYGGATGTAKPIMTLAETREFMNLPPATPDQVLELQPPEPEPLPLPATNGGADAPKPADSATDSTNGATPDDKTSKKAARRGGRSLPPVKRNKKHSARVQGRLAKLSHRVLKEQRKQIVAALRESTEKFAKSESDDVAALIKKIIAETWDDHAREELWTLLASLTEERTAATLAQLKKYTNDEAYAAALTQANERAVEWARSRATNMITETNDTTRQLVNELTSKAIEDGITNTELGDLLEESFGFSSDRSDLIARTETNFAETAGTIEGYDASGVVEKKGWSTDGEACDECTEVDGEEVDLDDNFSNGVDGPPLHPACFLPGTLVATAGRVTAQFKRWFEGEILRVRVETGHELAVTPNHPILTLRGWVAAGELVEGDYLVQAAQPSAVALIDPDDHNVETAIEDVACTPMVPGGVTTLRMPVAAEDFHGDGAGSGDVEIVAAERLLRHRLDSATSELVDHTKFVGVDTELPALAGDGAAGDRLIGHRPTAGSVMGSARSGLPDLGISTTRLDASRVTLRSDAQTGPDEPLADRVRMAADGARQINTRLAEHVTAVKLTSIVRGEYWSGHVYNLETQGGWYLANSIVVHNCECVVYAVLSEDAAALIVDAEGD